MRTCFCCTSSTLACDHGHAFLEKTRSDCRSDSPSSDVGCGKCGRHLALNFSSVKTNKKCGQNAFSPIYSIAAVVVSLCFIFRTTRSDDAFARRKTAATLIQPPTVSRKTQTLVLIYVWHDRYLPSAGFNKTPLCCHQMYPRAGSKRTQQRQQ